MVTPKTTLGRIGEERAVEVLKNGGYRIVERNFQNTLGEIDIIAYDGDTLCFIEVKTRNSDIFGSPFESVTPAKQKKMTRVALSYLKLKGQSNEKVRFDVVGVCVDEGRIQEVELLKNAFEAQ